MKRYPTVDNARGLKLYGPVMRDTYGSQISVRESSADPMTRGWLFIEGGVLEHNNGAAHLTVNQASRLILALQRFVKDKRK